MSRHKEGCSNTALNRKKMGVSVFAVAFLIYKLYKMLGSKGLLPPTDVNEKFRFELLRSKLLPQFCKHSESVDLLCKSLLPHVWRVPSSKALSCKHERLFDLLTLASYNIHSHIMMLGSKDLWPPTDIMCAKNTWCGWSSGRFLP